MRIEVRSAEGGDHAKKIVGDLTSAYTRYLDRKGWLHTIETADGTAVIICRDIPEFVNEAGGHRWQELSGKGKKAKIHTSTVTVSVILEGNATNKRTQRHDDDFAVSFYSGTGKGGQHRNKHQNCVRMTHVPTGLMQTANGRERQANLDAARAALEARLDDLEQDGAHAATNSLRKDQIGSGQRGDKRRTYRFQDDRVADHETGKSMRCKSFMKGNIEEMWR